MEIFLIALVLGLLPAAIAAGKGRSFLAWWLYGALLFIVALPHALMLRTDAKALENEALQSGDRRKCPFCAEIVKAEAKVCRFCGRDLPPADTPRCEPLYGAALDREPLAARDWDAAARPPEGQVMLGVDPTGVVRSGPSGRPKPKIGDVAKGGR